MELIERLETLAEMEAVELPVESFEMLTDALREAAQELRRGERLLAEARSRTDALRAEQAEALAKQVSRIQAAMEEAQRETLEEMRRQMTAAVTERDKLKAQLAALAEKEGA